MNVRKMATLVLTGADVASLATPRDYLEAVESGFRAAHGGSAYTAPVGHVPADGGGFHIKSARLDAGFRAVAVKVNGNFPGNPDSTGLPTIQGCLMLADAIDGRLLAVMDSIEITARRTAAASALAARHLARRSARILAFVGCGVQARCHLDALVALDGFAFAEARIFDPNPNRMDDLARDADAAGLAVRIASSVADATREADIVVLTTTATQPILRVGDVQKGTFIAAVGADSPAKSEVAGELMALARVVPDVLVQAAAMGDLRRAIAEGAMTADDVHGELGAVICGAAAGRTREDQIFVFDSTGCAIEDVASAWMLYAKALERGVGLQVGLNAMRGHAGP
jgi:alanine dehydrogenase